MKRIAWIVVMAACLAAGLWGQSKMAVSLDTMPLFKGLIWADSDMDNSLFALSPSFEYLIAPHYSIGGTVDLWFGEVSKIDVFYFGLIAQGRWYPLSEGVEKFFLSAGLGFDSLSVDGKTDPAKGGGFVGLTTELKAGWRLVFSRFLVEPSMAYVYSKSGNQGVPTPLGWQGGLRIGVVF